MQTGQFASAPDAVRLIATKEGFKGLYAVCNPPFSITPLHISTVVIFICLFNWKSEIYK